MESMTWSNLLGTPAYRNIYAIIQTANHVSAAQCKFMFTSNIKRKENLSFVWLCSWHGCLYQKGWFEGFADLLEISHTTVSAVYMEQWGKILNESWHKRSEVNAQIGLNCHKLTYIITIYNHGNQKSVFAHTKHKTLRLMDYNSKRLQ